MSNVEDNQKIGTIVGGALSSGLEVRLDSDYSVENLYVGDGITIEGREKRYFGIISDMMLQSSDSSIRSLPPNSSDFFVTSILSGTSAFTILKISLQLAVSLDTNIDEFDKLSLDNISFGPATTLPPHFSPVYRATSKDYTEIFGSEDENHGWIGTPKGRDAEVKINLDLEQLIKRSNGVFGKTGTGKTFLTRVLLSEIIKKDLGVNLIFDMHRDYSDSVNDESGKKINSLKQIFPSKVEVMSLGKSLNKGQVRPDAEIMVSYNDLEVQDIEILSETLNLTSAGLLAAHALDRTYGDKWLGLFLNMEPSEDKENPNSLSAAAERTGQLYTVLHTLWRRLEILKKFEFLQQNPAEESIKRIFTSLERGKHVILDFGTHQSNETAYILVTSLITRRIYERWAEQDNQLVIAIEEAHKFLNSEVASQTIFGTIAREMRKWKVTLLVVDQRPSGIDAEVLSQLGTKFIHQLEDNRDIDSILAGSSRDLRSVVSTLAPKQQALVIGHSLPMPVVIDVRSNDTLANFINPDKTPNEITNIERDNDDLFGEKK
ncbi:MAG: ATP-binding protein [SAR202 cluster bacterium]|nr:hypothetical protein [Chloroflexota bacterium]MQG50461.1 ATP-binding protein [SAR202 cluster bacterium]|tara:strand:+ start:6772 stop:8409 length:1638 start_codon:yes stop_codon:yes gene_type:complete